MRGLWKFLFGAIVGGVFGFLVAPKQGQRVRELLFRREQIPPVGEVPHLPARVPEALTPAVGIEEVGRPDTEERPTIHLAAESGAPEEGQPIPTIESPFDRFIQVPAAGVPAPPAEEKAAPLAAVPGLEEEAPPAVEEEAPAAAAVGTPFDRFIQPSQPSVAHSLQEPRTAPQLPKEPTVPAEEGPVVQVVGPESPRLSPAEEPAVVARELPPSLRMTQADLKARIEETRRRIQRELELRFARETDAGEDLSGREATAAQKPTPLDSEPVSLSVLVSAPPLTGGEPGAVSDVDRESTPKVGWEVGVEAEPGVDESAAEQPVAPETQSAALGTFDYEAMRRRIEDTRSRLKAKAFDAMMSGESALLSRNGEPRPKVLQGGLVEVDSEVDLSIEATLTEEDF